MKKIFKIVSIVVSAFSIVFLLYGSMKLARVNAATVPQEINSGIPGVEIAQPSKVLSNEDAQIIIGVAGGTLILGVFGYIASSQGIESRDYLRSLVSRGNGEILLVPIEKDRYGRTVAELYVQDRKKSAIALNLEMVRAGYAWHYERYSAKCPSVDQFAIAQELAQDEGLGIWNGSPQPPWQWRKANK